MRLLIILFTFLFSININAQLRVPNLSPSATVKQTIGLTEITVSYFRPSARGRTIFGDKGLLPYNEIWRTGANNPTMVTFSNPVSINGRLLEKGNYTILSIPGKTNWQMNWYVYTGGNWDAYVEQEPIISLQLPVDRTASYVETFEIRFQEVTLNSASLLVEWENTSLKIPITIDEQERILKSIDNALAGPSHFDYYFAALYLHESNTQLNKALEYIQKATSSDKALFFQVTREALILQDLGKKEAAKRVAKRGLALSKEAGNNDFVRLNTKIIEGYGM